MKKLCSSRWLMALLLTMLLSIGIPEVGFSQQPIRWGTSVLGAGAQALLAAVINMVTLADPTLGLVEQTTSGPIENVRLLNQKQIEIAQTVSSDAWNGYFGKKAYASQGPTKMLGLFAIYPANMTFAVRAESNIHTIEDLKDKRVVVGPPGAGSSLIMTAWVNAYTDNKAKIVRFGYREGADALRDRSVDAALVYGIGEVPVEYLQELDLAINLRILGWDISGLQFKRVQQEAPEMATYGTFSRKCSRNLDRDLLVPTTYSAEYSDERLPEEVAYRLLKTIWEKRERILSANKLAHWMVADPANMLHGLHTEIPVHPGAARFYKEMGVWSHKYTVGKLK